MASLQLRHSRGCALGRPWTGAAPAQREGCTCQPTFYVVFRHEGRLVRERAGRSRRHAERQLARLAVAVDEGAYRPLQDLSFREWGERWLANLERKPTTRAGYAATVAAAARVFGATSVRRLGPADVARFSRALREAGVADSTRARHLRVLGACLNSAIRHGYAAVNPVRALPQAEKPRAQRKEAAYFTDEEIPPLFAQLEPGLPRVLCETALKSGCRLGELLALRWGDVDLAGALLHVRRTVTGGHVQPPKNHERRQVDLPADLVATLGRWWGELGRPGDEALVFGGPGGFLDPGWVLRRHLYPALQRAGIPREGPTGERRTFHSFRHTFARVALEAGAELTWLSRHLGHSSTMVTDTVYGHWARAARKRQLERVAGALAGLYAQTYAHAR